MEDKKLSFWTEASYKIKTACVTFFLAKIIFFPAALMIFIPLNIGSLPFFRNVFFSLYCLLVFSTLFLCCWELLSDKSEDVPSEDKVMEWLNFYAERKQKNDQ